MVTLQTIKEHNYRDALRISHGPGQERFVADSAEILSRAYAYREHRARAWGIYAGTKLVGLALLEDLDEEPACYHLSELLIDQQEQGKGYGSLALGLVVELCRLERKYPTVEVCVHQEAAAVRRVYERIGFVDTGFQDEQTPESLCLSYSLPENSGLQRNLQLAGFEDSEIEIIVSCYEKKPGFYKASAEASYLGTLPHFPICQLQPIDRLVTWALLLGSVAGNYALRQIPPAVIWDTMQDVALRASSYAQRKGRLGLSQEDVVWLRHLVQGDIFKLGVLQFQPFRMIYLDEEGIGEPYMQFTEKPLPSGAPVLNVHIQEGAELSDESVSASFAQALEFCRKYIPNFYPRAFLCYAWLLYPSMEKLLPQESRIRRFAEYFTVIGTAKDRKEALRRIYGRTTPEFPQDTSLRRAALGHFECLGEACGIWEICENT